MSPDPAPVLAGFASTDRRIDRRYPVSLELSYRIPKNNQVGVGRTINMSSGGICFCHTESLVPGTKLEVALEWPFPLNGTCPLKMCISGRVLWNDRRRTAIKILRYEFRTRRQIVARTA